MRRDRRLIATMVVAASLAAALLAAFALAGGALVWSTLPDAERAELWRMLGPHLPLLVLAALATIGVAVAAVQPFHRRWLGGTARLLEQARVLLSTDVQRELEAPDAATTVQDLARLITELAQQRDQLRRDIAKEVAEASRGVEQERNRLAALMSELTQSVVVCNLDGRILLYNNRARMQFRALSDAPALADGAELIGLGRSIYTVFDRKLVAHALESVQQRLQRGATHPSAQFVTATRTGQLLRAQMAPVRGVADQQAGPAPQGAPITGFVLMLDNITRDYEHESGRERLLHGLTEGSRGSLANLQVAAEMLDDGALDRHAPALRRHRARRGAGDVQAHQRTGRAGRPGTGHALAARRDARRRLRAGGAATHREFERHARRRGRSRWRTVAQARQLRAAAGAEPSRATLA